jgi:anti-sigma regulatory factor (Ser/Thr protein kinase)
MQVRHSGSEEPTPRVARRSPGAPGELDAVLAANRRQAHVIETLSDAVATLRTGAAALKAENVELRADNDRLRGRRETVAADDEQLEFRFTRDARAPRAARAAVAGALGGRVPGALLERARLVASELTTDTVVHGAASPADGLVLRVQAVDDTARLEVEDPGPRRGVVPRDAELAGCPGLHLVDVLSERWGVDRVAGATRIWALLAVPAAGAAT